MHRLTREKGYLCLLIQKIKNNHTYPFGVSLKAFSSHRSFRSSARSLRLNYTNHVAFLAFTRPLHPPHPQILYCAYPSLPQNPILLRLKTLSSSAFLILPVRQKKG